MIGSLPLAAHASSSPLSPPATVVSQAATSLGPGYRSTMMHFGVRVGPQRATPCDIVAEYFLPAAVTRPVPAILTTNGFGGSFSDQEDLAKYFSARGYAVLTYSGLGFGGSSCAIELDDPDWDGAAASQLISWLGNRPEIVKDGPDDPRVGMVGGSYGGDVQFSTAAVDSRLDTIVPIITWNDLAYSLTPNNNAADFVHRDAEPGVLKLGWPTLFFADGMSQPLQHGNPTLTTCPGFDPRVCAAFVESAGLGYPTRATIDLLRHTSMVSYFSRVRIPTMLLQGEGDTLFTINEAIANYRALQSVGAPVKLVIQSWGHSQGSPAPGEVSYTSTARGYETLLIADWFAKYLKDLPVSTGPGVEYFRDWVTYDTKGSASPAYGTAPAWPVGTTQPLHLSGAGDLVSGAPAATNQSMINLPGGQVGSFSEISGLQGSAPFAGIGVVDVPGTFVAYATAPLKTSVDSVGIPVARIGLRSAVPAGVDPASDPILFAKLYDVAPDGTVTLVQRLVSPVRIDDVDHPVTITLPGVVHRYLSGHRIKLVLATADVSFSGARVPNVLTVTGGTLDLPVVAAAAETTGGPRATP